MSDPIEKLPGSWTLWFYHRDRSIKAFNYFSGTKEVTTFDTPEKFWTMYVHLAPLSSFTIGSEYQVFRTGIKPIWEDKLNIDGGRWALRIKRDKQPAKDDSDKYAAEKARFILAQVTLMWERLLVQVVSGALAHNRVFDDFEVCGVVVSVRREEYIISLWNKTATDATIINALREAMIDVTEASVDDPEVTLEYSPHAKSLTKVAERARHHHGRQNGQKAPDSDERHRKWRGRTETEETD